jgi:hypothetical protein
LKRVPVALWLSLGTLAAYAWLVQAAFYFPKYTACVPVLVLFAAACAAPRLEGTPLKGFAVAVLAILFAQGFAPSLDPFMITEWRSSLGEATHLVEHLVAVLLPCALLVALWRWGGARPGARASLILLGLICSLAGLSAGQAGRARNGGYLYGEAGFEEAREAVLKLKEHLSPRQPVLSASRDLAWALPGEARFVELLDYETSKRPSLDARILVSRTYSQSSIAAHAGALREVNATHPCHRRVSTPGERFEWWWRPAAGEGCQP